MLSPDGQNGRALFKGSKNSTTDKGMIISKAAKIIRKSNFENVEISMGNSSKSRIVKNILPTLDALRLHMKRAQLKSRSVN